MIKKILYLRKKKDWRGYKLIRKAWILSLFTVKPMYVWEKYPDDFYKAFELDRNDLCNDHIMMGEVLRLKYGSSNISVLMTIREMMNLHNLVQKVKHLDGEMAEVGVYQGGSATLISRVKGDKPLHLFDTFEGLPEPDKKLDDKMVKGDMSNTSLEKVKKNLESFVNVFFYKGFFPATAGPIGNKKFCFVNNDTDIYDSSKAFLEFFYTRVVKGGIILTHDYSDTRTPGVKKAFDEFFADKPEFINEIWETQAYVVKL
jgi:O-methyltransferase